MPDLTRLPTAPLIAAGLVGGFALAQATEIRPLGGAIMLAANAAALPSWWSKGGAPLSIGLSTVYWLGMGVSHPLAKEIGVWPSVLSVAAVSAAAAWGLADRRNTGALSSL